MYAVLKSFGLHGLEGFGVAVEADVSGGMDAFSIVGLPDSAVRESADRVRAAGTEGVLEVRGGKIFWIGPDGEQILEPEKPDRHLFSDFVLELSGGRPALVSDRETLELTRACLLAREAADTGTKILF